MSLSPVLCASLAAVLSAAPASAAGDLAKLLPDDADFVLTVNVKQARDWPQFKKRVQGEIEYYLKSPEAQNILKDTGFDPLKDLDRVTVAVSSHDAADKDPTENVFVVLQGKFDADKLREKAERLAKDGPKLFKVRKAGDAPMLEIALPVIPNFLVLVDNNTLVVTNVEAKATEAVDKAAGKKKTELKSKRLADLLAKTNPELVAEWFAGGEMSMGYAKAPDKDGKMYFERVVLKDGGVEGIRGGLSLGESDAKFQASVYAKDAAVAKDLAQKIKDWLDKAVAEGTKNSEKLPTELKLILEVEKSVKVATADDAATLEGSATADAILVFVKGWPTFPKPDR